MSEYTAWLAQRISAAILAPLVLVHAGLIIYASNTSMTAADILSRTQGSTGWRLFYGLFVAAAAIHAPLGVRNIIREWTPWRGPVLDWLMATFALGLLLTGWRAVAAVT